MTIFKPPSSLPDRSIVDNLILECSKVLGTSKDDGEKRTELQETFLNIISYSTAGQVRNIYIQ